MAVCQGQPTWSGAQHCAKGEHLTQSQNLGADARTAAPAKYFQLYNAPRCAAAATGWCCKSAAMSVKIGHNGQLD